MSVLGEDVLASLNTASRAQTAYATAIVLYRDALAAGKWDGAESLRPLILAHVESFLDAYAAAAMRLAQEPLR